jgi:Fur family transcriptional regulator, peroxide stress response regulator
MERTAETLAARVDHMIARCRDAGMNVTPQRIAVYRALLESEEHPTPEMLFNAVSPAMPSLSLATIYKSLEALQSLGLVREVPVVRDSRRYDANLDAHHHLVCERCGSVTDYYDDDIVPALPRRKIRGFSARSVTVNITGVCAACTGTDSH